MKNLFPMHEGIPPKPKVYPIPEHVAGLVFTHADDCYRRNDFTPNINCACFDWASPDVTRNVITVDAEELAKIKRSMKELEERRAARRREPLPIKDTNESKIIDNGKDYGYNEWVAYLDGLLEGLKAAERTNDDE